MISLVDILKEIDCWDGKKLGTPKTKISYKTGKRVNNCVPIEELNNFLDDRILYKITYLDHSHHFVEMTKDDYDKQPLKNVLYRDAVTADYKPTEEDLTSITAVYTKSQQKSV